VSDRELVQALKAGDGAAYAALHGRYSARLVSLAMSHGCTRAVAEEVVQDTWTAVVRNIHAFEGRAAFKTWLFRILVNAANAQVKRERRTVPVEASVIDLAQARARRTAAAPQEELELRETIQEVTAAIKALPPAQRRVITLRDVRGWSAEEVCEQLEISDANQRVLLHRARTYVRNALAA
jgi:RNA polymerase sigma-70 factor (ECF subfamily)